MLGSFIIKFIMTGGDSSKKTVSGEKQNSSENLEVLLKAGEPRYFTNRSSNTGRVKNFAVLLL